MSCYGATNSESNTLTKRPSRSKKDPIAVTADDKAADEAARQERLLKSESEYEELLATQGGPSAAEILSSALGLAMPDWFDPSTNPDLENTPRRFLKYLQEFNKPFFIETVLGKTFPMAEGHSAGVVVQGNIPFRMICAHHLLPAIGRAWVGYLPRRCVVGLSKIARLVDAVGTCKPSMQEDVCAEIADHLHRYTDSYGVICVIKSIHTCMACRGVNVPDTQTSTSAVRGLFLHQPAVRSEFFQIAGIGKE